MTYKPNRFMPPMVASVPIQERKCEKKPRVYANVAVCLTCPYPSCKRGDCDRVKRTRRQRRTRKC